MHCKKRRLLALLCVLQTCIGILGCAESGGPSPKQNTSAPVTLRMLTSGSSNQAACNRISEALSRITLKRYGFAVKMQQANLADYSNTINRELTLGEAPDLFLYSKQNDLAAYVEKNAVLGLDSLLKAEGSSLLENIRKDIWETATLYNTIFAVPAINGYGYSLGFVARKDIVDVLGVKPSDIKDLDSLHRLLLRIKSGYSDIVPVVSNFGQVIPTLGEDPLGDDLGVLLDGNQQTVENLFSSKIYHEMCQRMHQWYTEGLILENAYSYDESNSTLLKAMNGFGFFVRLNEYSVSTVSRATGNEMVVFRVSNPILNTSNYNSGWCISAATLYAKQALQLLSLLYTDQAAADLFIYGQEGVDYTRLDANKVYAIAKKDLITWNTDAWAWTNRMVASDWKLDHSGGKPDKVSNHPKISKAMGFVFDSSPVRTATDQCKSIVEKYNTALLCGYLDPDEVIPRFLKELKEAGLDTVIATKKYQLNAWFANKI